MLYGIHGAKDGRLGNQDNVLVRCFKLTIEQVNEEEKKLITEKNILIEGVVLDTSSNKSIKNHGEMIKAIKGANILILSFCYTNVNVLNNILRSEGLYAEIILRGESSEILENGKLIQLDPAQKEILDEFIKQNPDGIFLIGHYGTGKSLLLVLMMAIRIGDLVQKEKKITVIITADVSDNSLLLKDLEEKYLQFIKNINAFKKEEDKVKVIVEPLRSLMKRYQIIPNNQFDFAIHEIIAQERDVLDKDGWMKE